MSSPFDNTPAIKQPSRYAALTMRGEQFTGLWTQRSPYRDAAVPYNRGAYGRFDSMIDGLNREITQCLTDKRRPGSVVYNDNTFPAIASFYSWKYIQDKKPVIRSIADGTDGTIYDATAGQKSVLMNKSVGAGPARFLGVNTELFIGDGVETKKIVRSKYVWKPAEVFTAGQFLVDPNGNIQVAYGAVSAQISTTRIFDGPHGGGFPPTYSLVEIQLTTTDTPFFSRGDSVEQLSFVNVTIANVLNGKTLPAIIYPLTGGVIQVQIPLTTPQAVAPDTGTVYSSGQDGTTGATGATQPAWATGYNEPTEDGRVIWINKGPQLQNWGMVAPTVAPTISQIPLVGNYKTWAANTFYFTQQVVVDPTGVLLLLLLTPGVTAATTPVFTAILGHATTDGTAVWVTVANSGTPPGIWVPSVGRTVGTIQTYTVAGTDYVFRCFLPGTTGTSAPPFTPELGSLINDNDVVWQNVGPLLNYTSAIGVSQAVETTQLIVDPDGYEQDVSVSGKSGATIPTFDDSTTGATTIDGAMTWIRGTEISTAATAVTQYAYSWKSSVTRAVSNASPLSIQILRLADKSVLVQGPGPTDPQDDMVVVWRYVQGGSVLIEVGEIPVVPGIAWTFLDQSNDQQLIAQIAAPIAQQNNPPPSNLTAPIYHLRRIWGIVDNMVVYSGGPDTLVGSGFEAFDPTDNIPYPAQPIFLMPVTVQGGGILVFTTSGVYIILGTGTANDPFYTTIYYASVNLSGYNAIDVYNTAVFLMESNGKVSTLAIEYPFNPQSGYNEVGFPIGDQFRRVTTGGIDADLYDPATAYVSWHYQSSADTNMFVSDGSVGWFAMNTIPPPESGILWNPRAAIVGGTSAVQSIETSPGVRQLLIGPLKPAPVVLLIDNIVIVGGTATISHSNLFLPAVNTPIVLAGLTTVPDLNGQTVIVENPTSGAFQFETTEPDQTSAAETGTATVDGGWVLSGPIYMRDSTGDVYTDRDTAYPAWDDKGVMLLCSTGQWAEVSHISAKSRPYGSRPKVSTLIGEIYATTFHPWNGLTLNNKSNDPPETPKSITVYSDRYVLAENGVPCTGDCLSVKFDYGTQDEPDELLDWGIFASLHNEREEETPAA